MSVGREKGFLLEGFVPAYSVLVAAGGFGPRVEEALSRLRTCRCCPRACGVNRMEGETGFCRSGRHASVVSAFAHGGEEGCLRGTSGSGTIFFNQCNLRCLFCQNWDISQGAPRGEIGARELAAIMLELEARGCHNINLVTPTHFVPQIIEATAKAAENGLRLPIVYNSGGYDSVETLRLLDGIVDIYMPDFKFWKPDTAERLASAPDYPERARGAISEMHRQVGPLRFGPDGLARRGLLVRQLVMPGLVEESEAIYNWLAREISPDTFINVMAQYRPEYRAEEVEGIDHHPSREEILRARSAARKVGLWRFDR